MQIASADLDAQVSTIAGEVAVKHGLVKFKSYVTQVERARFFEIGFVGAAAATAMTLGDQDAIR